MIEYYSIRDIEDYEYKYFEVQHMLVVLMPENATTILHKITTHKTSGMKIS